MYTAIINYIQCNKCGGIGQISEYAPCGCSEGCERCDYTEEVEVSCVHCNFCNGLVETVVEQFQALDLDAAVAILETRVRKLFNPELVREWELEKYAFTEIQDRKNVWYMMFSDDMAQWECYLIRMSTGDFSDSI